ncbi:MAG: cation diffusion facilitator family transporter [Povalibacter sp.]
MDTLAEQRALKFSIAMTLLIGLLGVVTGLLTGSQAIIFDGMYSFVDVVLTIVSLAVSKLLANEGSRRFQYGYSHLEPVVGTFGGAVLALACVYAVINAIKDLLGGGHTVDYGFGAIWAGVLCMIGSAMAYYMSRMASRLASGLLSLDARSWLVSAVLSLAVLLGFVIASSIQATAFAGWVPYVDSLVLLCTALAMLPVPIATIWRAMREVLQVAPGELDQQVRAVMKQLVTDRGFLDYSSHVAKIGRTQFVEIHILVTPDSAVNMTIADGIRREIAGRLNAAWPQFWLTIDFTADRAWM